MAAACDFDAIPRSITSAGSVRFFPRVSGFTKPIVTYAWTFGDGDTSAKPTPIHEYPAVTDPTTYTVTLTVTDSDGNVSPTKSYTNFIRSDAAANVSAPPNDGTYHQVSVLIFDDTNAMLVNRNPWTATDDPFTGCHLYLLNPKTIDSIDKIGMATFSLLDVGDSSATEKTLMKEKKNIVIILGKTITFSGKIRRITQNTQAGWDTSTRIKLWDVECDSDLSKLAQVNVDNTMLAANVPNGQALYDTPGNLARLILTQTSPARDILGVISCIDAKTEYQINSSSGIEQVGNQYDHLTILQAQTNYDLRSRADFLLYNYTAFNGATVITNSAADWTGSEFVGMFAIFVGRDTPASKTFTVVYTTSTSEILVSTASTFFAVNDRVTLSTTGVLPTGLTATTYYVKTVTSDHLTLSTTIGGDAVTFSTNGTGTHSVVLKAETDGVVTYGKITANDATTITCAAMVGAASAPQSLGYFLIYRGYLIDFAHDLSQPVAIENLDINKDVFQFSDNDDKRKLSTKIVATGKDLFGKTISVAVSGVHAYDEEDQFFNDSTFIKYPMEGYVYKNGYLDSGTDYNKPLLNNEVWVHGWDYALVANDTIAMIQLYSSATTYTITTASGEFTDKNGVKYTKFLLSGVLTYDYGGNGFLMSAKLYVDDFSRVGTNAVLIGEEPVTITDTGTDPTYGDYIQFGGAGGSAIARFMSTTKKAYPHGVGALVARTNYTEADPETLSPIAVYGLYIDPRTVDNNITYGMLDAYATSLLLGLGHFYKKANTWGPLSLVYIPQVGEYYGGLAQQSLSIPPRTSDRVSFTEYDGADPVEYQIVVVTIDYDRMTVLLELGDFEKNVFTSLLQSTNAVNRTLT